MRGFWLPDQFSPGVALHRTTDFPEVIVTGILYCAASGPPQREPGYRLSLKSQQSTVQL